MVAQGMEPAAARTRCCLFDSKGLVQSRMYQFDYTDYRAIA